MYYIITIYLIALFLKMSTDILKGINPKKLFVNLMSIISNYKKELKYKRINKEYKKAKQEYLNTYLNN